MKHIRSYELYENKLDKKSSKMDSKVVSVPHDEIDLAIDMVLSMTPEEAEIKAKEMERDLIGKGYDIASGISAMEKEKDPEKAITKAIGAATKSKVLIEEALGAEIILYFALMHGALTYTYIKKGDWLQSKLSDLMGKKDKEYSKKADDYLRGNAYLEEEYKMSKIRGDRRNMGKIVGRIKDWAKYNISGAETDIDKFVRIVLDKIK